MRGAGRASGLWAPPRSLTRWPSTQYPDSPDQILNLHARRHHSHSYRPLATETRQRPITAACAALVLSPGRARIADYRVNRYRVGRRRARLGLLKTAQRGTRDLGPGPLRTASPHRGAPWTPRVQNPTPTSRNRCTRPNRRPAIDAPDQTKEPQHMHLTKPNKRNRCTRPTPAPHPVHPGQGGLARWANICGTPTGP